ncbi:DsbA family protein [Erythrobacter sp. SDW2]|uniref:DsbA family protein n=1 Tax=Erythrobacter sp. SDW2 TaxID=2907154 RepID=UPI001F3663E0|nr:DsbA family protein [Erythrobacter sp. SDW2]UIP07243.1 DsbA family protein [Erythrobacter sp. SDW2]
MQRTLLTIVLSLVAGFAGAAAFTYSGLGDRQVERYLLANPELLPRVVAELEKVQAQERLASAGMDIFKPFDGAILGNPNGKHTLVKFTDYNCGYCRASAEEVQKLLAADPELKVIIREWPIFGGSDKVAALALAATRQGKYEAFHQALFAGGDTSEAGMAAAAREVGLDLEKLKADAASPQIAYELNRNTQWAQELGFTGTPSWIAGGRIIEGAVPAETLAEAIAGGDSGGGSGAGGK